jgi:hypothetical protein
MPQLFRAEEQNKNEVSSEGGGTGWDEKKGREMKTLIVYTVKSCKSGWREKSEM